MAVIFGRGRVRPDARVEYESRSRAVARARSGTSLADLDERALVAGLGAGEAWLTRTDLELLGDWDVRRRCRVRWCRRPDSTRNPGMLLDRDRGDDDLLAAVREVYCGLDAVSGQVEQHARRVPRRARKRCSWLVSRIWIGA